MVGEGEGEAAGGAGETAATTGGVMGAIEGIGDFAGATGEGAGVGEFCATMMGGVRVLVGDGVGEAFWFFLFPLVAFDGVGGGGAGGGVTTATFGASIGAAGSTRINSFAAGGGGVGARPATDWFCRLGETRSR